MRLLLLSFAVLLALIASAQANEREQTVCGFIKEPLLFWFWSSAAPEPDESRINDINYIKATKFNTSDGKTLRGYKYLSNDGKGNRTPPKGYVLMALGNAMIADQIIGELRDFAASSYDVYIYDYRGYGNSEGKRRINAIIEDYKEIISSLNGEYEKRLLYGISLGGAIILNAIGSGVGYDSVVIDSSPSLLSEHGCPERIDPIKNLPKDSRKLLVITGKKDPVLNDNMTSLLRVEAQKRGASVIDGEDFSHPFMDQSIAVHKRRMKKVLDHLVNASNGVETNE